MISDNITPVLKHRFRKEIRITADTGKERGFFICKDEKGYLVPSKKTCQGTECEVTLKNPRGACPIKIQGDFHTHPDLAITKIYLKEQDKKIDTDDILKDKIIKSKKEVQERLGIKGLPAITPSYSDALKSILVNCASDIEGTACVGSDLEDDKVECWTPKKDMKLKDCQKAEKEYEIVKGKSLSARKWIVDLFDKETIDLKQ